MKWDHPSEWLDETIGNLADAAIGADAEDHDAINKLTALARDLARLLDGDQIQDAFQSDMDADGYFAGSMPRPEDDLDDSEEP